MFFLVDGDVAQKPENRGDSHRQANGSNFKVGLLDDFDLALKEQLHGPLPGHDVQRLEGGVEHTRVAH